MAWLKGSARVLAPLSHVEDICDGALQEISAEPIIARARMGGMTSAPLHTLGDVRATHEHRSLPSLPPEAFTIEPVVEFRDRPVSGLVTYEGETYWFEMYFDEALDDVSHPRPSMVARISQAVIDDERYWHRRFLEEVRDVGVTPLMLRSAVPADAPGLDGAADRLPGLSTGSEIGRAGAESAAGHALDIKAGSPRGSAPGAPPTSPALGPRRRYGEGVKPLLMSAALCGLLGLPACSGPSTSTPAETTATVAGKYVLDLQKPGSPNLRLWVELRQAGAALSGVAYAGYVTPPSGQFIEPYSGQVTGSVVGAKAQFTVNIKDFYDTGAQVNYAFSASTGAAGTLSGTWTRAGVGGGAAGAGNFSAVAWTQ